MMTTKQAVVYLLVILAFAVLVIVDLALDLTLWAMLACVGEVASATLLSIGVSSPRKTV